MWRHVFLISIVSFLASAWAADARHETSGLDFSVSVRTPEQQRAFYAARGFPEIAIREIAATCFLTVGIYNRSQQVVWLEPANWRLVDGAGKPVPRISRETWERTWERLAVPLASRATFGWTQLPESRDLQPGEPVGGNLAVVAPNGPFTLTARFRTDSDGRGAPIEHVAKNLVCPNGGRRQ